MEYLNSYAELVFCHPNPFASSFMKLHLKSRLVYLDVRFMFEIIIKIAMVLSGRPRTAAGILQKRCHLY